jgi:DNA-binding transcriptional MocR family regulator
MAADLSPGDRLPSNRELVERYRMSPVTVSKVVARLSAEGVVVTRPGSGTYVANRARLDETPGDTGWQAVALAHRKVDASNIARDGEFDQPGGIMLDGGYLHRSLQPVRALGAALARAALRPDAWDRAPANGLSGLRTVFAELAGGDVSPDDVLVTAGGQSGLSMALRAIAEPGDYVLVESPTYPGALAAARSAGLRPIPVPTDDDGLRTELLAELVGNTGARLVYCQPAYQNPTGRSLAPQRRADIVDIARANNAFVIEDDFARFLAHDGLAPHPLVATDKDGTVIYLTSLTKPAAPSMRIGALIARGPVMERIRAVRLVDDFFVARPMQEAALELISSPTWHRHLRGLARMLRERCQILATAILRQRPDWTVSRVPDGGLHLWVRLPHGSDTEQITRSAQRNGAIVGDGLRFFPAEPLGPYLRLAFAACASPADLAEGAKRLAGV